VIGVSSGAFTVTGREEKMQLIGFFKKAQSAITKGVQFVQLDLESLAEFKEPDLKKHLERIKEMGIRFGVHSETAAFGIEMAEPDSAIEVDYKHCHQRLLEILEESRNVGAEYVLIHSSESVPFALLGRHLQPAILVDVWGRPLREFIEKADDDWVVKWILPEDLRSGGAFIWTDILHGSSLEDYFKYRLEAYKRTEEYRRERERGKTDEEISRELNEYLRRSLKEEFLGFVASRTHTYGPERYAYYIIAKWMEREDDPLWNNIIEANIKFYAKYEGKTPEEWLAEKRIEKVDGKWSIDDPNFREEYKLWVPAVSAKYIWGHFNQERCPGGKPLFRDLKEKLKVKREDGTESVMPVVLESPMAHRGTEEWLRLPNPLQMYYLVKDVNEKAGFKAMGLAFDLEHMISIRVDPETVIELFPEGAGETIKVVHAGWPAPLAPAHLPIQLGSEQQFYLYKVYYKMRQKGFGKTDTAYIIFERGGPETFQESILSLRQIVKFLEKDTPPDKLPPEFSGIATGAIASEERQLAIISEHAEDPLKGLIAIPEEEYTMLGRAATAKPGGGEKWTKEELR